MYVMNVFVSHSWEHSDDYDTLSEWIFGRYWAMGPAGGGIPIHFENTSVPKDNPIHHASNVNQLKDAIFNRIFYSDVVVIPTGMYSTYSRWIKREIDGAKEYCKPIIAVIPRGQIKNASVVSDAAQETVGWMAQSVVGAICKWGTPRTM